MIRSAVLLIVIMFGVLFANGSSVTFDSAAVMAVCVAVFGLLVGLASELMQEH